MPLSDWTKYYARTAATILPEDNWNHWKTSDFISCLITITPPLNLGLSPWRLLQLCTSFLPIFAILAILATFTTCLWCHAAANQPADPLQWSSTSVATGATPPRAMQRVCVGARHGTAGSRGVDGWSVVGHMVRVNLVSRLHSVQLDDWSCRTPKKNSKILYWHTHNYTQGPKI